jgi:L-rhamnose mutarotase
MWRKDAPTLSDIGFEERRGGDLEIYLMGTRMFMIMDVNDTFSLSAKAAADAVNAKVQEWETIMRRFQEKLPQSGPEQWWVVMDRVFNLSDQ